LGDQNKFEMAQFEEGKENKELRYLLNMEETIKETLQNFVDKSYISQQDYDRLAPSGSQPGILYGLPKIHKIIVGNCPPCRPILSAINTPTYKIAKFLVPILATLTKNEYTVQDSFKFAEDIRKQNKKFVMASLDVDSLFTNIPLDETIQICANELFKGKKKTEKVNGLTKAQITALLKLATKQSFFLFNNNFYIQKDGVAMGNPLGPTLANAFLCFYEKKWLKDCPKSCRPIYYKRYVDDIFVLFENMNKAEKFKTFLNKKHKNMSFTLEVEKDNKLSFLDIDVIRGKTSSTFITSLYRKPTFSGMYTNFKSFISTKYKYSLISSLLYRVFMICSDYNSIITEIEKLKIIWLKNAFPMRVIDRMIFNFFDKIYLTKKVVHTCAKKKLIFSLEYLGKNSLEIKKRLERVIEEQIPFCKISIVFSSKKKIRNFFAFKDKVPKNLKSLVLYKFTCSDCNVTYIGKTKRHYQVRFSEHLGISKVTNQPLKYSKLTSTAVRDHIHFCKHKNTSDSFKIIGSARNDYHLKIKESLNILRENPLLNKTVKSFPLHLF